MLVGVWWDKKAQPFLTGRVVAKAIQMNQLGYFVYLEWGNQQFHFWCIARPIHFSFINTLRRNKQL
jgi:hypothetical protein